ncbi:transcription factor domain-containing protein [Aspergillus stella-maris]|uniref:transcription factor domain-containing protein n=1 Tax=Aspergillus stella-maris TaxID=1810926 RepID=UPI003CCE07C9
MSEFPLHLAAFRALQAQFQQRNRNGPAETLETSPAERYLTSIFYLQSTLSLSTNCELTPVPWPSDPQRTVNDTCLQYTYGTTKCLAMFIRAAATLFRSMSYYISAGVQLPAGLQDAVYTLLSKLNSWSLAAENIIELPDFTTMKVMKLHILAFHDAIHIFCEAHKASSEEIRLRASRVLTHLQCIENIKQENSRIFYTQAASILWPGFIASCEAVGEDRSGWTKWWEHMLTYRIGNIASLYATVREVWQLSNSGQGSSKIPVWRVLLKKKKVIIIAL